MSPLKGSGGVAWLLSIVQQGEFTELAAQWQVEPSPVTLCRAGLGTPLASDGGREGGGGVRGAKGMGRVHSDSVLQSGRNSVPLPPFSSG